MGSSKRIALGVFWTTLFNIVNAVYGFISVPLLIANYGKSNYGLIGLAVSVNVYLRLMDLGFNSTNVRFFSNWIAKKEYDSVNKLFKTSLSFYGVIGLINAIVLIVVALFADSIFNVNAEECIIVKNLLYILAISAFISWFSSCFDQLIKACEYVGWLQKISLIPKISQMVILVLTLCFHYEIETYYALTAFSMFIVIPFAVVKIRRVAPYVSFIPGFNYAVFKEILPYCVNIFSFGIFQFSINYLRPIFLGVRGSMESVADYRVLNGIISVVLMVGGSFMGVLLPSASKSVALNNQDAQSRIAYAGTKYISIVICFCCFGIMSISNELLCLYVGEEYSYLTFWLDLWLVSTLALHNQAISSLVLSGSNIKTITICTIISSIVGLVICWLLIPVYEVGGTVIGYLVYCLLQIVFYYVYYWPRKMNIDSKKVFFLSFAPVAFIGLICSVAVNFLEKGIPFSSYWTKVSLGGIAFTCLYVFFVYLFILNKDDKDFFVGLVKKK